jgi:hypothetical protein
MNIVLIPCIKSESRNLGANYEDFDSLSHAAINTYFSAIKHISDADEVIIFHVKCSNSIQEVERKILSKMLELNSKGNNVLLLEADTLCVRDFGCSEFPRNKLQLFTLIGMSDFPEEIEKDYYLNSGVIWFPYKASRKIRKSISFFLSEPWPNRWAYYQLIWNLLYYGQFKNRDRGLSQVLGLGSGKFNWIIDDAPYKVDESSSKIMHFFTSRGIKRVVELQNVHKSNS